MAFNCSRPTCCFCCLYRRCLPAACYRRKKNKTAPDEPPVSPAPSIALTNASRSQASEEMIQDQLSVFHFGTKSPSGRRYSHPNQLPWVEEYERRKSNPGSPSLSLQQETEGPGNNIDSPPPESPIMQYPVVPPGRLM